MNYAHLHLTINHVPVILFPAIMLLLAYAMLKRDESLKRVMFGSTVIVALVTIVVYRSGLVSDDLLGHVPGYNDPAIDVHKQWAVYSLWLGELTGVFCLLGLLFTRRRALSGSTVAIGLILLIVVSGLMGYTSYLGGHIRHPETYWKWKPPAKTEEEKEESSTLRLFVKPADTKKI